MTKVSYSPTITMVNINQEVVQFDLTQKTNLNERVGSHRIIYEEPGDTLYNRC
jgi:hypothetical protein